MKIKLFIITIVSIFLVILIISCSKDNTSNPNENLSGALITFIEFGSMNCIPCKEMQPILKSLEERYNSEQLEVRFIDVFKDSETAKQYKIEVIPTQVFLNKNGEEIQRHVGFYPEEEIVEFLRTQGLEPIK
jgi:thioredoxin 1